MLTLSNMEIKALEGMLSKAEAVNGNDYTYKPDHIVFACTCQGNCDGRTSGCSWG